MILGFMSYCILVKLIVSIYVKFIMLKGVLFDDMFILNIICIIIYGFIFLNDYNYML